MIMISRARRGKDIGQQKPTFPFAFKDGEYMRIFFCQRIAKIKLGLSVLSFQTATGQALEKFLEPAGCNCALPG
jgi:hypothetical protein